MKQKILAAWGLTAVIFLCPLWHMVTLAGGGRYPSAVADLTAGQTLLAQYDAVSVETAQEHIDSARLEYQNWVAAANLQQVIDDEIAEIEKGNLTYREVFQDVYLCGDSLMCGLDNYGLINGRHLMAQVGANLGNLDTILPRIISAKPRVLILHYGINSVSTRQGAAETFVSAYGNLIDKIKAGSPNTRIIVSLIFPVNEKALARDEKFSGIPRFNQLLIQMCAEKEIEFLDTTDLLHEHDEFYTVDGIHQDKAFFTEYWFQHMMREMEIY